MSREKCPACNSLPRRPHADEEIQEFHPKDFLIKGADGETLPIAEFYFNTKARARRKWTNSLSSVARQIDARLEMATMGFQQELAVKMVKGVGIIPLRPIDVIRDCQISKRLFRHGMDELKAKGLGERRGTGDGPLHKGKVELYSWALPRAAQPSKNGKGGSARPLPGWFPLPKESALTRFIKRLKLELVPDLDLNEAARAPFLKGIEEAARELDKAERGALSALQKGCAQPKSGPLRERTDRTERTADSASSSTSTPAEPEPAPTREPDDDDVAPIVKAFGGKVIPSKARRLRRDCGAGITVVEIAAKAAERIEHYRGNKSVHNAPGLVIKELMEFFHHAPDVAQWRREREDRAAEEEAAHRRAEERAREISDAAGDAEILKWDPEEARREGIERMARKIRGEAIGKKTEGAS